MKVAKMVLFIILGLICIFIIFAVAMGAIYGKINKTEQANEEVVLGSGEQQALILYQESKGSLVKRNMDRIADELIQKGYQVTMNHPRKDNGYQAEDYDVVVLASPVYARQISEPLCAYADSQDFSNTKVFLVVTGLVESNDESKDLREHINDAIEIASIKTGKVEEKTIQTLEQLLESE
ncbi:MAG: hypothetical protein GX567_10635 [Clostridia bacterium]|nr:hypothetical protein [Clostridia bacterium]